MRNEDLTNIKTATLLNEKYNEDKSSFSSNISMREIFKNCVSTLNKLNYDITTKNFKNYNQTDSSLFYSIKTVSSKLYLVLATFISISFVYYVYIYVSIYFILSGILSLI